LKKELLEWDQVCVVTSHDDEPNINTRIAQCGTKSGQGVQGIRGMGDQLFTVEVKPLLVFM
jgi:hypothetical protein